MDKFGKKLKLTGNEEIDKIKKDNLKLIEQRRIKDFENNLLFDFGDVSNIMLNHLQNEMFNPLLYKKVNLIIDFLNKNNHIGKENKLYKNDGDDILYIIKNQDVSGKTINSLIMEDQNCIYIIKQENFNEDTFLFLSNYYKYLRSNFNNYISESIDNLGFNQCSINIMENIIFSNFSRDRKNIELVENIYRNIQIYGFYKTSKEVDETNYDKCIKSIYEGSDIYSNGEITNIFKDLDQIRTKNSFKEILNFYGNIDK